MKNYEHLSWIAGLTVFASLQVVQGCQNAWTDHAGRTVLSADSDHAYDLDAEEAASKKAVGRWEVNRFYTAGFEWPSLGSYFYTGNQQNYFGLVYQSSGNAYTCFAKTWAYHDVYYVTKFQRSNRKLSFKASWGQNMFPSEFGDPYMKLFRGGIAYRDLLQVDLQRYADHLAMSKELTNVYPDAAYLQTIFQRKLQQQQLRVNLANFMGQPSRFYSGGMVGGDTPPTVISYVQTVQTDVNNLGDRGQEIMVVNDPRNGVYRIKVLPDLAMELSFDSNKADVSWAFTYAFDETRLVEPFVADFKKSPFKKLTSHRQWQVNNIHKFNKAWSAIKKVISDVSRFNTTNDSAGFASLTDIERSIDETLAAVIKPNETDSVSLVVVPEPALTAADTEADTEAEDAVKGDVQADGTDRVAAADSADVAGSSSDAGSASTEASANDGAARR